MKQSVNRLTQPDSYRSIPDLSKNRRLFTFNPPIVVRLEFGKCTVHWAEGVEEQSEDGNGSDLTLDLVHVSASRTVRPAVPVQVWVGDAIVSKQYLRSDA